MKNENTGFKGIVCLLIVIALVFSSLGISGSAIADDDLELDEEFFDNIDDTIPTDEPIVEGNLTQPFLKVTGLFCNQSIIHFNESVILFTTILNTGGSSGDENYTSLIIDAKSDIANLIENTTGCAKKMLEKAEEQLEKALDKVEDSDRTKSIFHISRAIVNLQIAQRKGVDTSEIIVELATVVKDKLDIIVYEAETSFGSEHPDVKKAKKIYKFALNKFEDEKYLVAVLAFELAFKKVLNAYTCDVNMTLFDLVPDMEIEEKIGETATLPALKAENEETIEVIWRPTELGIHYVKTNMTGEYEVYSSPATTVESPPTILSVGFPVSPLAIEPYDWHGGYVIPNPVDGDSLTIPKVDGNTAEIIMDGGDLIINEGGILTFKDGVTFVIDNSQATWPTDIYGIKIQPGVTKPAGQFNINSPAKSTYIYTPNTEPEKYYTYPFLNSGTVSFTGANVLYTYGNPNLELAGGIRNLPGSTCVIDNCYLLEADSHSLYIEGTADVQVKGVYTVIGSGVPSGDQANGHGIFVKGATPIIEDVTVQYNKQDGIHVENSVSGADILASELDQYSSFVYDYRITSDPADSTRPKVAVGDDEVTFMVWLDDRDQAGTNQVFFKMLKSDGSWSGEQRLSTEDGMDASEVDIAVDGNKVCIVYRYPSITSEWWKYRIMFKTGVYNSIIGDVLWDPIINPFIGTGIRPSVAISGSDIYVAVQATSNNHNWNGENGGDLYVLHSTDNGATWDHTIFLDSSCYETSMPKIVASDDFACLVWAREGSFYHSYRTGAGWSHTDWPYPAITTYGTYDGFNQESFDITIKSDKSSGTPIIYLVWSSEKLNNFYIYYKHGKPGVLGRWSDDILVTSAGAGISLHPCCTLDSSDNVHIVWQEEQEKIENIRYSCIDDQDAFLVFDVELTKEETYCTHPSISINGNDDRIYLIWEDGREDNSEIFLKRGHGKIVNNDIKNNDCYGVYLDSSSSLTIDSNAISTKLYLYGSNNNQISKNIALGGISLVSSNRNTIRENVAMNDGNVIGGGIYLYVSHHNTVISNVASNNKNGIYLRSSNFNTITHNIVCLNLIGGIYLKSGNAENTFSYNTAKHNLYGINFDEGYYNTITYNNISSNKGHGIRLLSGTNSNLIYHNNLIDNLIQAYDDSVQTFPNLWDNGYPSGGNYWSDQTPRVDDFSGPLQDIMGSDGIVDERYTDIGGFADAEDCYPLMEPIYFARLSWLPIRIDSNADFNGAHGVTGGSGTEADPWVIEYLDIDGTGYGYCLYIGNTTDYFEVRDCILHEASGVGSWPYFPDSGLILNNVQEGTIVNNKAFSNDCNGIHLDTSIGNTIIENTVQSNDYNGIYLDWNSDNNNIAYNIVISNWCGIQLIGWSLDNIIVGNTVSSNNYGFIISESSNGNLIYNNNIIANTEQQAYNDCPNFWNNGYPFGGNYWSDHSGDDGFYGPSQDMSGSDGIIDRSPAQGTNPYMSIQGGTNQDDYPLKEPFDPDIVDTDGDGLLNVYETRIYRTNANDPDTDGDDVLDGHLDYDSEILWISDNKPNTIFATLPLTRTEIVDGDCIQYPMLIWDEDNGDLSTEQIIHFFNQLKSKPLQIKILEEYLGSVPQIHINKIELETGITPSTIEASEAVREHWELNPDKQNIIIYSDSDYAEDQMFIPYANTFAHRHFGLYLATIPEIEAVNLIRAPQAIYYFGVQQSTYDHLSTIVPANKIIWINTIEDAEVMLSQLGAPIPNQNTLATDNAVTMVHKFDNSDPADDSTYWGWVIEPNMQFWKIAPIYSSIRQTMLVSVEHNTKWIGGSEGPVSEIHISLETQLTHLYSDSLYHITPYKRDLMDINYLAIFSHWMVIPYRERVYNQIDDYWSADCTHYADRDGDKNPDVAFGRMAAWDVGTLSMLVSSSAFFDAGRMIEANRGLVIAGDKVGVVTVLVRDDLENIYGLGNSYTRGDPCNIDYSHDAPLGEFLDETKVAESIIMRGHGDLDKIWVCSRPYLSGNDIYNNRFYNPSLWFFDSCISAKYQGGTMTLVRAALESGAINAVGSVDLATCDWISCDTTDLLAQGFDIGTAFGRAAGSPNKHEWYLIGDPMVNYKGGEPGDDVDLVVTPSSISIPLSDSLPLTIKAEIRNIGGLDANNFIVQFWDGDPSSGTQIGGDQTISVPAFSYTEVTVDCWNPILDAAYDIYVVVDPSDTISEALEDNNIAYTTTVSMNFLPGNPSQNEFTIELYPTMPYSADTLKSELQYCIALWEYTTVWAEINGLDPVWSWGDANKYRIYRAEVSQEIYFTFIGR